MYTHTACNIKLLQCSCTWYMHNYPSTIYLSVGFLPVYLICVFAIIIFKQERTLGSLDLNKVLCAWFLYHNCNVYFPWRVAALLFIITPVHKDAKKVTSRLISSVSFTCCHKLKQKTIQQDETAHYYQQCFMKRSEADNSRKLHFWLKKPKLSTLI